MSNSRVLNSKTSALLVIDLQARLMPAIAGGDDVVANAQRLLRAATLTHVPVLVTEQNPRGLGPTVPELEISAAPVVDKMTFDATGAPNFPPFPDDGRAVVVLGCEAHVCVLQTVLGLIAGGHRVFVVEDAIGSRAPSNKVAAVARMRAHGAEILTTEMVIFEWIGSAEHPHFKELIGLVKH